MRTSIACIALAVVALLGCGGDDGDGMAGADDARPPVDARAIDAGPPDSGMPCADAAGCAAAAPVCDPSDGVCVQCVVDDDCAGRSFQTTCDPARRACVECVTSADCGDGTLGPACDTTRAACTCEDDESCLTNSHGPRCDELVRACTCRLDGDCGDAGVCDPAPELGLGMRVCQ